MSNEERPLPTSDEVNSWLTERRNWGRWGDDDSRGAVNLITDEKRLAAFGLVQQARVVSISREYPKNPGPTNPVPAQHFMRRNVREPGGGSVVDYYGFIYHGYTHTHLDALCHVWDKNGAWQGRDPDEFITGEGVTHADVTAWDTGIITRGVLLDVPRHRGTEYVTVDRPVHGWELEEIAEAQGVSVGSGDALLVYSGREAYQADNPDQFLGDAGSAVPGLHASCLPFVRDHDVALLGWDMMDAKPNEYDSPWAMHGVIYAYGVPLLDNALLQPLADVCAEQGRHEFLLMISPLKVVGGNGQPGQPARHLLDAANSHPGPLLLGERVAGRCAPGELVPVAASPPHPRPLPPGERGPVGAPSGLRGEQQQGRGGGAPTERKSEGGWVGRVALRGLPAST